MEIGDLPIQIVIFQSYVSPYQRVVTLIRLMSCLIVILTCHATGTRKPWHMSGCGRHCRASRNSCQPSQKASEVIRNGVFYDLLHVLLR